MSQCHIIAHTGCEGTRYNTMESSMAGFNAGADVLEVDVRLTKDEIAVLFHDDKPNTALFTYEQWNACGHDPIMKLEDALKPFQGKPVSFNLDLKTNDAYPVAAEIVSALEMWDQVYFTGVTAHLAQSSRANRVFGGMPDLLEIMSDDEYEKVALHYCQQVKQAGFVGINVSYSSCRPALIEHARRLGLLVWIYTLPSEESLIRRYVDMGVNAVSVYDVSICVKMLKRSS